MNDTADHHSFGVFKPVGHVVISFPNGDAAHQAIRALAAIGIDGEQLRHLSDAQMRRRLEEEIAAASPLASVGQEMNLAQAQLELARLGYHWLVVRAKSDGRAFQIADCVKPFGAERAQYYGHFVIEELIEHTGDTAQVAESPARGLDAQTPSGLEAERSLERSPRMREPSFQASPRPTSAKGTP